MKILHLTAPARFGGLESVVLALAGGQRRRGHRVGVAAVLEEGAGRGHPFVEGLTAAGVEVAVLEMPHRAYARERRAIGALLERFGPEVAHSHGYRSDVLYAPLARRRGVRTVSTVHGFTGGDWKNRFYEALQVRAFRKFDAVVAVSSPLRDQLGRRGVPEGRLHVHPNTWRPEGDTLAPEPARRALGVSMGAFHIGWIGRLSREKGPDVFVEALERVRDLPWVASIIGTGPMKALLEERCRELGLADRIRWHGDVRAAGGLMRGFDTLVLSSRTEGTPIVLLEALAAGTPIVATPVGGIPDLVGDAALLATGDVVEGLAASIRALCSDPGLLARMRERTYRRFEGSVDGEAWLEGYERIYQGAALARVAAHPGGEA